MVYFGYKGAYKAFINLAFVTIVVGYYKTVEAATAARDARIMEMGVSHG